MNRCIVFAFIAAAIFGGGGAARGEPCALPLAGTGTVAAIRDGRTMMMADGRELRLAGIEVAGRGADALRALVDGQTLRLQSAPAPDRYGRLAAYAYRPGASQTVQETLLEQGEGLVSARIGAWFSLHR